MYGKAVSYSAFGIDALKVEVEADIKPGLFKFSIVGLPSNSIKESRDRISAALKNSGYRFPAHNYTVNLAPADLKKDGVALDLPTALALLAASGQIDCLRLERFCLAGELSLEGQLRPIRGILPVAIAAWQDGLDGIILPAGNADEAGVIAGLNVYPVQNLAQAAAFLEGRTEIAPHRVDPAEVFTRKNADAVDMQDVRGQRAVKRALEIAAAGGHNMLMIGPPGSGKTMLARRLSTILPELTLEEALQTTKIHSVSGLLAESGHGLVTERPFRSPHHTISDIALIGGGSYPRPGEVSLAHNGVLFLDELPEFAKTALEVLRQPLEDGVVNISRASQALSFPADFMLVASMNPCPCGYFGANVQNHTCSCGTGQVQRYRARVSGPLLDRIDLHVEVPVVRYEDLSVYPPGESSVVIRERVNTCRGRQRERFKKLGISANAQMNSRQLRRFCQPDSEGADLLRTAMDKLGFSARAYDRILKVARTIADLANAENIGAGHVAEAIQYRTLDRKYW